MGELLIYQFDEERAAGLWLPTCFMGYALFNMVLLDEIE